MRLLCRRRRFTEGERTHRKRTPLEGATAGMYGALTRELVRRHYFILHARQHAHKAVATQPADQLNAKVTVSCYCPVARAPRPPRRRNARAYTLRLRAQRAQKFMAAACDGAHTT
eukprot:scaffold82162_cov70-Phaeocystis_antarctica.AAC.7